jgi:hypothetical protein
VSSSKPVPPAPDSNGTNKVWVWRISPDPRDSFRATKRNTCHSELEWGGGGRLRWLEEDFFVSSNSQLRRSITKYVLASHSNLAIEMILNENEKSLLSKPLPWKVLCSMLWNIKKRMTIVGCVSARATRCGWGRRAARGSWKKLTKLLGAGRIFLLAFLLVCWKASASVEYSERVFLPPSNEWATSIGTGVGLEI